MCERAAKLLYRIFVWWPTQFMIWATNGFHKL